MDEISTDLARFKQTINDTASTSFVMKPGFEQFTQSLPIQCEPCYSGGEAPLIDIIKENVLQHLGDIETDIVQITSEVTNIYKDFLDALTANSTSDINTVLQSDIPKILDTSNAMHKTLHKNITLLIDEALTYVERFASYMAPICHNINYDSRSNQVSLLYERMLGRMLGRTKMELSGFDEKVKGYLIGNNTLEDVARYSKERENTDYLLAMKSLNIEAEAQYNSLYLQVSIRISETIGRWKM